MNTLETKDFASPSAVDITIPDPDTPLINALVAELGPDNVRALLDGSAPARDDGLVVLAESSAPVSDPDPADPDTDDREAGPDDREAGPDEDPSSAVDAT